MHDNEDDAITEFNDHTLVSRGHEAWQPGWVAVRGMPCPSWLQCCAPLYEASLEEEDIERTDIVVSQNKRQGSLSCRRLVDMWGAIGFRFTQRWRPESVSTSPQSQRLSTQRSYTGQAHWQFAWPGNNFTRRL